MSLRPAAVFAVILAVAGLALTGCAPIIHLGAAADANDPRCAEISVRLPDTVAGKPKQETDAQATGAWGSPSAVLLRCGVPPLPPTTKPCITVNGIDWVLVSDPLAKTIVYQTFGRVPATEVIIAHGANGVSDASVLPDLANAIASVKQTEKCLDLLDTETTPTPSPSN